MQLLTSILSFLLLFLISSKPIVLRPLSTSLPSVALVFIQGTNFASQQYVPLLSSLQSLCSSSSSLWIGISDFALSIPDPLVLQNQISSLLDQMKSMGMTQSTKVFYAGHGLGGILLANHFNTQNIDGLILLGSFLPKALREITNPEGKTKINFPSKVLTIANELDGLCRIMRMAEAYYHSVENIVIEAKGRYPVVVVKGASHMQFASGDVPSFVQQNDLKPEITEKNAQNQIALAMKSFIENAMDFLDGKMKESDIFFKPLIDALKMEGSYHLKPPCYDDSTINRKNNYCGHGSEWVNLALKYMAGFEEAHITNVKLTADDNFHKVWTVVPDPLPSCLNNCTLQTPNCQLLCVSVTELSYNTYDSLDNGFYPISADEMKTKMSSREALLTAAGLSNVKFNLTDGWSSCKFINDKAIEWALANASPESRARFSLKGEKYQTVEDKDALNGGSWIIQYLNYQEVLQNGVPVVQIGSYTSRYPLDYWLPLSSGFHFCKLLSPARVMEWIYLDSLKKQGGIA